MVMTFTFHGPAAQVIVPPLFHVFFTFPLFLAELGIVTLLWKLGGEASARRFFLNPLVILVSAAWTVEALMTYPFVLSVLMVRRARYLAAAVALATGALVKFVPAILLPTLLIYLWHQRVPRKTLALCGGVFLLLCVVVIAPFWKGFQEVLLFQAARPGANLSVHLLLYPLHQITGLDIRFLAQAVSPLVGLFTQTVALALVYIYLFSRTHALTRAYLITLIAFFLGSKIVNEPYPYVLIPLILLELADHAVEAKETALKLLYALPLAFAILNVPLVYIVMPLYRYFWKGSYPVTHEWARAFPLAEHSLVRSILMLAFVAASVYTLRTLVLAGFELLGGILILAWLLTRCHRLSPWSIGLGAPGGILPDLVDASANVLFGVTLMHIPKLHWTVTRRYALLGILTQVVVAGAAAAIL